MLLKIPGMHTTSSVVLEVHRDIHKKYALCTINLIKYKRCGKVKGNTCADGSPHKNIYCVKR